MDENGQLEIDQLTTLLDRFETFQNDLGGNGGQFMQQKMDSK